MANEEKPKVVAKPVKKESKTVVSVIKEMGITGAKDRAELAKKVFAKCKQIGLTKNSRGHEIREARVKTLISAMCRDIISERKGWWNTYKVVEDKTSFKMLAK